MLLPFELVDYIFSLLWEDISALKACLRIHRSYSRLAERYFFADIVVKMTKLSKLNEKLSKNPHILNYPRTLEILAPHELTSALDLRLLLSTIPRMPNLASLTLHRCDMVFLSSFSICLQQSSIKQIHLHNFSDFPLSILDQGKNIKKLTLSGCTAIKYTSTDLPHQSLDALAIKDFHNPDLLFWATDRVANLTTLDLEFQEVAERDWTGFPDLLMACSKSLRNLTLDFANYFPSVYSSQNANHPHWIDDDWDFPFTLSSHKCLRSLSIFTMIYAKDDVEIFCGLPVIVQLIKTAPSVQSVVLSFNWHVNDTSTIAQLDWSPLALLRSDVAGIRPYIEVCVYASDMYRTFSPESVLDALAENEAMMDLVKQEVIILKSGHNRFSPSSQINQ